ncbi:sensor histidine kinase [Abyssalbus ytuae]|uniref:Oxygen sensor histidine kinase NreB n=1 Tax=Abyssalbus ytuae TaxID=2926907 RepID=A0A9E6ZX44_9FLAO|nr:sensor histidine kinase [Abyssalbus ytuae]UOB19363.1 sensor histidine kinase [Abyssalbus ytuae]
MKNNFFKNPTLFIWFLLMCFTVQSQNKYIDSLLDLKHYSSVKFKIDSLYLNKNVNEYNYWLGKYYLEKNKADSSLFHLLKVDSLKLTSHYKAYFLNELGKLYGHMNLEDKAVSLKLRAKQLFKDEGLEKESNRINYDLHYIFLSQEHLNYDGKSYLDELYKNSIRLKDTSYLINAHFGYAASSFSAEKKNDFMSSMHEARNLNKTFNDSKKNGIINEYYGLYYTFNSDKKDSALYYLNKNLELADNSHDEDRIFTANINRATFNRVNGDFDSSVYWMKNADTIDVKKYKFNQKRNLYKWLSYDFYNLKKTDSAYKYLEKYVQYSDSVQLASQNTNLTMFRTLEAEKARSESERRRILNRNLLWGSLVVLAIIGLISVLSVKNLKKKKKIIEIEKQLQSQQIEQLLKEQELLGIDAMIEGQEKERKRIAMDLHDNLGSILATLKLHFQNLKVKKDRLRDQEDNLLKKTDDLIEEAYQKVRSIAHAKNAGVKASEGLVPAIQNFASKVSVANKLVIEVIDDGMEERLDNSLEISLFRITQELITNVIRHAQATEATIHLTHHEDSLNLMVEDNGVGFEPAKIKPKEGMGLHSIQRRIEHIGGEVNIESVPGKGTTVIIDIPLT